MRITIRTVGIILLAAAMGGCVSISGSLSSNIVHAIVNQNDPATVRDGAPAYLLMIDGFIEEEPDNRENLIAGARLYSAYAAVFVDDPQRAQRLAAKARDYSRHALCLDYPDLCNVENYPYDEFVLKLATVENGDIGTLYTYGVTWAIWIDVQSGNWHALADLPKVEAIIRRVVDLNEHYENGQPYMFLGIMNSYLPPAMGGRPEEGRAYFEKAITLSDGKDLSAKVEFARRYARLVFDKKLHDDLLKEVLAADAVVRDLTLSNTLAQEQARKLLDSSQEYFLE